MHQESEEPAAAKNTSQVAQISNQQVQQTQQIYARYPEHEWFQEWKKTLNLQNVRACISHTYNKAMNIRTQMIEQDYSLSSLQIFNIDEDIVSY